jgi:hypothetical protein
MRPPPAGARNQRAGHEAAWLNMNLLLAIQQSLLELHPERTRLSFLISQWKK